MCISAVGAFSLVDSRIWRIMAHSFSRDNSGLENPSRICHVSSSALVPQYKTGAVYHFRTPSLGGQPECFHSRLSAIFLFPGRNEDWLLTRAAVRLNCAMVTQYARLSAQRRAIHSVQLSSRVFGRILGTQEEGVRACNLIPFRSLLQSRLALRPVATRRASRSSSVVPLELASQPSPAKALQQALQSAPRATCSPAKRTSPTADRLTGSARERPKVMKHRRAVTRGGVFRLHTPQREVLCSRKS